jgi:hypothetical protein
MVIDEYYKKHYPTITVIIQPLQSLIKRDNGQCPIKMDHLPTAPFSGDVPSHV